MRKKLSSLFVLPLILMSTTTAQSYHLGSISNNTPHIMLVERANFSVNSCFIEAGRPQAKIRPFEMKKTIVAPHTTYPYFASEPRRLRVARTLNVCPSPGIYNTVLYTVSMKFETEKGPVKVTCSGDSHGKNKCTPGPYKAKLGGTPTGMPLLAIHNR